jgi:hypothetical protein
MIVDIYSEETWYDRKAAREQAIWDNDEHSNEDRDEARAEREKEKE